MISEIVEDVCFNLIEFPLYETIDGSSHAFHAGFWDS
jgi:hypothetical protein